MKTVILPEPCPWVRVGPYYPGIEYDIEDDAEAQRLVEVKGLEYVVEEED